MTLGILCTVGNFGSYDRMDYTIIGSQVNLASRLESLAEPGGILLSYATYALVKDKVSCEKRDPIAVKGLHYRVETFKVIDFHERLGSESPHLEEHLDGFSLAVDLDRLSDENRDRILAILHGMVYRVGRRTRTAGRRVKTASVLETVASVLRSELASKDIHLETRSGVDDLNAPEPDLVAVITELVRNAIRISLPGQSVAVEVSQEDGSATIAVSDEAAPIPRSAVKTLFEPNEGGEPTPPRLSLHRVVPNLKTIGGRISLRSVPNRGNSFVVSFPA